MNYTIIEDCSPYYIKFIHDGIDDIVKLCNSISDNTEYTKGFTHQRLELDIAETVLKLVPMSKQLSFLKPRVSLFVTQPGHYYRAHKDGLNHRIGINYMIKVLDNKCITSWYSDDDLKNYPIDNLPSKISREADGFIKENHLPLKSTSFVQGECVLFNTDIFHDFDNTQSTNERVILTLRLSNPGDQYFNDVKEVLFGERNDENKNQTRSTSKRLE